MPVYEIEHPTTGQKIRLEGNGVPSDSDIREAFNSVAKSAPTKMLDGKEYKDARAKFIEDTGTFGTQVKEKVLNAARTAMPYVRPVVEGLGAGGGAIVAGAAATPETLGVGTVPAGIAGAALGYAGAKNIMDTGDKLLGTMPVESAGQLAMTTGRDLLIGATMEAGGQVTGKAVGYVAPKVVNAYRSARAALANNTPALTKAGVNKAAGQILVDNTGTSPIYDANAAAAAEVQDAVPGFRASMGEQRNDPGLIQLQRGMERGQGNAAKNLIVEKNAANRQALDGHLDEAFPSQSGMDEVNSALGTQMQSAQAKTQSAYKVADQAAAKLNPSDVQTSGNAVIDALESESLPAKRAISERYKALPDTKLPTSNTAQAVKDLEKDFRPGDEEVFPSRAVARIKEALQGPKPKTGGHHGGPADPVVLDAYGQPMRNSVDPTKAEVGFQDLHSLRKDLGRQIQDASTGMNPNRELAMKLQKLKNGVDLDIESGMKGNTDYADTRQAFSDYANKFRTGDVEAILRRGNQPSGRNVPDAMVSRRMATLDGADGLINAVGKDKAAAAMQGHFAQDLLSKADPQGNGILNPKALASWVNKNGAVLDKYGIKGQYDTLNHAYAALDNAKATEAAFNKTVAAKVLNSDPQKAIAAAMGGAEGMSAKNTGAIMVKLMKQVEGNPRALDGLKNAFKDFIIDTVETTKKTIAGDNAISPASIQKALAKYEPAMRVLYKDSPKQYAALQNVKNAVEIQSRSAASPIGGGSDTAENLAVHKALGFVIDKIPGVGAAAKLAKVGLSALKDLNAKEVNDLVTKALYDPELAQTLMMAAKQKAPQEVARRMKSYRANYITAGTAAITATHQGANQ